VIEKEN